MRRAMALVRSASESGNLYLVGMAASATGAGLLYTIAERDARSRRQLHNEFEHTLSLAREQAQAEVKRRDEDLKDRPTLWRGVLTSADYRLQGHLMLRGCRVGQEVDVLEEKVGQEERYLTVIDRKTGQTGWYLAEWVAPKAST
jgi:hypothetical protein